MLFGLFLEMGQQIVSLKGSRWSFLCLVLLPQSSWQQCVLGERSDHSFVETTSSYHRLNDLVVHVFVTCSDLRARGFVGLKRIAFRQLLCALLFSERRNSLRNN